MADRARWTSSTRSPNLTKRAGQPHPDGVEIHQPNNENKLLAPAFEFRKYGQCGMDISEVLPHTATIVDDACWVRSMYTEHNNHLEGLNMLLTCKIFPGRPVMGAWISYALGTENQNLPAYVVLRDPEGYTIGGKQLWANGYLPALVSGRRIQHQRRSGTSSESGTALASRSAAADAWISWPS